MPQFDPAVWTPQLVWLGILFVVLYLLMAKVALPRVSEVLEEREERINESLRKAETLRLRAEDAVAAYERTIADVRAKAAEEVRTAREQAAADSAERNAAAEPAAGGARSAPRRSASIELGTAAIAGLRDVAITVSGAAVERLIGQRVEPKALASAVDAALGARRR